MQTFRSRRGDPLKAAAAAVGEQQATNPFYIKATAVRRTTLEVGAVILLKHLTMQKHTLLFKKAGRSFSYLGIQSVEKATI